MGRVSPRRHPEPEDNALAADTIHASCAVTADPDTELHVSIAGGRKTMGFIWATACPSSPGPGQAFPMLVSEPFESLPTFYFPPASSCLLHPVMEGRFHTDARIMLAEIPSCACAPGRRRRNRARTQLQRAVAATQARTSSPCNWWSTTCRRRIQCGRKGWPCRNSAVCPVRLVRHPGSRRAPPVRYTAADPAGFSRTLCPGCRSAMPSTGKTPPRQLREGFRRVLQQKCAKINATSGARLGLLAGPTSSLRHGQRPRTCHAGIDIAPEEIPHRIARRQACHAVRGAIGLSSDHPGDATMNDQHPQLAASCRVAFAAFLHDLGSSPSACRPPTSTATASTPTSPSTALPRRALPQPSPPPGPR